MTPPPSLPINISEGELLALCQHRVGKFVEALPEPPAETTPPLAAQVAQVVWRNLHSGRVRRVFAQDTDHTPLTLAWLAGYVDRVIRYYLDEHARVERLAKDDDVEWLALQRQLAQLAYRMLQHRAPANRASEQDVTESVQRVCGVIYHTAFPYDVSFDTWAAVIVKNDIRQQDTRSTGVIDRDLPGESPDEPGSPHDAPVDPEGKVSFERLDVRDLIKWAMDNLSHQARQHLRQSVRTSFQAA